MDNKTYLFHLMEEQKYLKNKIKQYKDFLVNQKYKLNNEDKELLVEQLAKMQEYEQILNKRILHIAMQEVAKIDISALAGSIKTSLREPCSETLFRENEPEPISVNKGLFDSLEEQNVKSKINRRSYKKM